MIPAPEQLWPSSVAGWVGLVAGTTALALIVVDRLTARGKGLAKLDGKLDGLCSMVDDMEGKLTAVDGLARTVQELVYEWRGVDGNNGYKRIIQDNARRITEIERRNYGIDAVQKARDDDERKSGGQHRRAMDRAVNNLLPEPREDLE